MLSILVDKQEKLKTLCKTHSVQFIYVFGSASTGDTHSDSDIDFLVSFKPLDPEEYTENYYNLHIALENLFGVKVDLITDKSLSNPYFIESVEESKKLLYAA